MRASDTDLPVKLDPDVQNICENSDSWFQNWLLNPVGKILNSNAIKHVYLIFFFIFFFSLKNGIFEDEIEAFELSLDDLIDHDQNSKVLDLSSQKYRDLKKDELRGMRT